MKEVVVVETGIANVASIIAGYERAGARVTCSQDPAVVSDAQYVVLPGVGAYAAGMTKLNEDSLVDVLRERIANGSPTMAVCLGLQLLFEGSEESPSVAGLSILPGMITRFPFSVKVPQFGWNLVTPKEPAGLIEEGYAYFANSFRLTDCPTGWAPAVTSYGGEFVSAIQKGNVLACQFHPELSGKWGTALLKRWLERGEKSS